MTYLFQRNAFYMFSSYYDDGVCFFPSFMLVDCFDEGVFHTFQSQMFHRSEASPAFTAAAEKLSSEAGEASFNDTGARTVKDGSITHIFTEE